MPSLNVASPLLAATSTVSGPAELVTGTVLLAVPLVALAGLLSFLSPCVLPLAPAYLAYVAGLTSRDVETPRRGRVLLGTVLFVSGFTVVFVVVGATVGGLGALLLEHQRTITRVLGVVVVVLGVVYSGVLPPLQREVRLRWRPPSGLLGAPVLGVTFGLGWTPCIGPTLAAVQALTFTETGATRGALLTGVYALGLGLPFVLLALGLRRVGGALDLVRRHRRTLSLLGGGVLVAIGGLLASGVWTAITPAIQNWVAGYSTYL